MAIKNTRRYLDSDGVIAILKKIGDLKKYFDDSLAALRSEFGNTKIDETADELRNEFNTIIDNLRGDIVDTLNAGMSPEAVQDAYEKLTDDDPDNDSEVDPNI